MMNFPAAGPRGSTARDAEVDDYLAFAVAIQVGRPRCSRVPRRAAASTSCRVAPHPHPETGAEVDHEIHLGIAVQVARRQALRLNGYGRPSSAIHGGRDAVYREVHHQVVAAVAVQIRRIIDVTSSR